MDVKIHHDQKNRVFYAELNGKQGTLEYDMKGDRTLDYKSTFVPEDQRGKGIGGQIVHQALNFARQEDFTVIPSCPFVKSYIEKHPEFSDLTA